MYLHAYAVVIKMKDTSIYSFKEPES